MNAIILAAGVGHRFLNITKSKNKAFLTVGKMCLIERILCYLKEAKIDDITIVTGHMSESFEDIAKVYGAKLLKNRKYATTNNITSLEIALDRMEDTYIIHADVLLFKNIFKEKLNHSTAFTVLKNPKGVPQQHPTMNGNRRISEIHKINGNERIITLLGVHYWKKEDAQIFKQYLKERVSEKKRREFHGEWEDLLPYLLDEIYIEGRQIDSKYAMDINHLRDYYDAVQLYDREWYKE